MRATFMRACVYGILSDGIGVAICVVGLIGELIGCIERGSPSGDGGWERLGTHPGLTVRRECVLRAVVE